MRIKIIERNEENKYMKMKKAIKSVERKNQTFKNEAKEVHTKKHRGNA